MAAFFTNPRDDFSKKVFLLFQCTEQAFFIASKFLVMQPILELLNLVSQLFKALFRSLMHDCKFTTSSTENLQNKLFFNAVALYVGFINS